MAERALLGDVLGFMSLLWALDHGLQSTSKRMTRQLGVTGPQRLVVRIVGQLPGISPGQVARILHLDPSTLTGILGRLSAGGFIDRRRDPGDARRALLALTPQGRRVDAVRDGTVEAAVADALSRVPARARRPAELVLTELARALHRAQR